MNDQDRDLIAALAEGRLGKDAASEAIARLESDPELASEYAHQVSALEFLASVDTPQMTESERTVLHANLTEQLGLAPPPATVNPGKSARWWVPLFGLATAAAVVAAVVILPSTSDDTFDQAGATLDAENSTQTSSVTTEETAQAEPNQDQGAAGDGGGISVYETDAVELDELLTEAGGADSHEDVQRRLSPLSFKSTVDLDTDQVTHCLEELDAELPAGIENILVIGADVEDETTTVHLGFDYGVGVEDGLSFVLGDCALVSHSPQG